mgnify:CR=1 FL=1
MDPCNRHRIQTRKKAYDEGEWVRNAAMAHAEKRARRQKAESKVA